MSRASIPAEPAVRIDKWLWAARFFKTRSQATDAISGGHVHLNDARIKPSRAVKPGDRVRVRKSEQEWTVVIVELSTRRGPASQAATLFRETPESIEKREKAAAERKLRRESAASSGKPDKRARRQIHRFLRQS